MKGARYQAMLGVFVVPMAINQWTAVPIGSQRIPDLIANEKEWRVKTEGNAGGFAYLTPQSTDSASRLVQVHWDWRVETFPRAAPKIPFEKSTDDYALRVGVLLSDGEERVNVPRNIKDLLKAKDLNLSYVVFYCAVASVPNGQACAISPYNDHIVNCLVGADSKYRRIEEFPVEDAIKYFKLSENEGKRLRPIGLWIFADSDNSRSSSVAGLRALEVTK